MFIDEKGKLFGKINILDLCVILAVIIGISGIAISKIDFNKADTTKSTTASTTESKKEKVTLEVGLLLKEVRTITRDAIVVGDEVLTTSTGTKLGKIKKVESTPSKQNILTDNGEMYTAVIPEKYDVTIYVETEATKTKNGYHGEDDWHFLFGKYIEIRTSTVKTMPMVSSIKEIKSSSKSSTKSTESTNTETEKKTDTTDNKNEAE